MYGGNRSLKARSHFENPVMFIALNGFVKLLIFLSDTINRFITFALPLNLEDNFSIFNVSINLSVQK